MKIACRIKLCCRTGKIAAVNLSLTEVLPESPVQSEPRAGTWRRTRKKPVRKRARRSIADD